ncbi:MAG: glutathione S-transferase [Flavobacteriales bacterium]|jgi:glutathione S-transferase
MKLYVHPLSGHAHRAQLFLSLAGIAHDLVEVDLMAGSHKSSEFLSKNLFGQVPVLEDDGLYISDSNAILVYAAKKNGLTKWYPEDAAGAAAVQRWLSVAAGQLAYGPAAARLITVFGAAHDPTVVIARAHQIFATTEQHLSGRDWLASTGHPTLADVAFYSYASHAPEGNVDLAEYPNIRALLSRVEGLPNFVPFVETSAGLRA